MPEITKKLNKFISAVDKLIEDGKKVLAAGKEIKDSLPKKTENEKHE